MSEKQRSKVRNTLPTIREVIAKYKLSSKKSLGQHFILDSNLTDKIARIAGVKGEKVIEIGPGPGGLTRSLLKEGARQVVAIEKDKNCIAAMEELKLTYLDKLVIIEADAKNFSLSKIQQPPFKIVSNLPYNISIPLLLRWLKDISCISDMTLMFQREVAERLAAKPSTKSYGRLSVITQWRCEVKSKFNIDPLAFTPPPKIDSTLVTLLPRERSGLQIHWSKLELVTKLAFSQRRKMIKSSLRDLSLDFEDLGIDPTLRAENLTVNQYCQLASSLFYN
ncbi:MAG: 16S rRNA (adenine(1518)-N(6)/adenine(1519)-N(6))-dimethyltransferase RsmA [Pseudomonadota bacterium]|nr:16S rRNA (adenine(1518)-N(6)/adenine(1519)-N(6))-dimethyltransferase RsmA [Pseudomonadota bacterium]